MSNLININTASLSVPDKFLPLIEKNQYRIKAYYGGRGGAKTQNFARAILIRLTSSKRPLRVLCVRSAENTMDSSVKTTFESIIALSGLTPNWVIYDKTIQSLANGSVIEFKGITGKGGKFAGQNLKSYEGADICWVEEAQTLTKTELDILLPTIRNQGSEIWFSFNRLDEKDAVWCACANGDNDVLLKKVGWQDNPYWTDALEAERQRCLKHHPQDYDHIYEGEPLSDSDDYVLINKLIVQAAQERQYNTLDYCYSPKIIGVDPARFGADEAVWVLRQGQVAQELKIAAKCSTPQMVDITTELIQLHKPQAVFVDRGGEGGSVVDFTRQLGYKNVWEIGFNDVSSSARYKNKRAEMYCKMKDWLVTRGQIDNIYEWKQELCAVKQLKKEGPIQLEDKNEVKKKIGRSPGRADALALTFAKDVKTQTAQEQFAGRRRMSTTQKTVFM